MWIATFGLTVVADLTIAVEVGMTLAALLYIYRVKVQDKRPLEMRLPAPRLDWRRPGQAEHPAGG